MQTSTVHIKHKMISVNSHRTAHLQFASHLSLICLNTFVYPVLHTHINMQNLDSPKSFQMSSYKRNRSIPVFPSIVSINLPRLRLPAPARGLWIHLSWLETANWPYWLPFRAWTTPRWHGARSLTVSYIMHTGRDVLHPSLLSDTYPWHVCLVCNKIRWRCFCNLTTLTLAADPNFCQ